MPALSASHSTLFALQLGRMNTKMQRVMNAFHLLFKITDHARPGRSPLNVFSISRARESFAKPRAFIMDYWLTISRLVRIAIGPSAR